MMRRNALTVSVLTFAMTLSLIPTGALAEELTEESLPVEAVEVVEVQVEEAPEDLVDEAEALAPADEAADDEAIEVERLSDEQDEPALPEEADALPEATQDEPQIEETPDEDLAMTALSGANPAEGECGDSLLWTLDEEGVLTISGSGDMWSFEEGNAPWKGQLLEIKTVTIEPGVTGIGGWSFAECANLTSVTIPEGVTWIGGWAFDRCSALTSIALPSTVTSIAEGAFPDSGTCTISGYYGSAFTWTLVPGWDTATQRSTATLTFHGSGALDFRFDLWNRTPDIFDSYDKLSVIIEPGATSIANSEFSGWQNLVSVTIPSGITAIEPGTFSGCTSLQEVAIPEGVTTIEQDAFGTCTSLEALVLPSSVRTIGAEAFEGCSKLASINIPEGVTSIEDETFARCGVLRYIELPSTVTSIGESAFEASGLHYIALPSGLTTIGDSAFKQSSLRSIEIPAGVTELPWVCFSQCGNLESVTLPTTMTSIGGNAFSTCRSLKTITLPASLTYLGGYAFENAGLTSIDIPNGVTELGGWAFRNCTSLTSASIPGTLTSVGNNAFEGCSQLQSVTLGEGLTYLGYDMFWLCTSLSRVEVPSTVTSIWPEAFLGCTSLGWVTLPDGLLSIGDDAFRGCEELTSITIPGTVKEIGNEAFNDTGLTQVFIPASVTSLGENDYENGFTRSAFGECPDLTAIDVAPANPNYSSADGLLYDKGQTTLQLCPDGRVTVDGIPTTVTTIAREAFHYCKKLEHVAIPSSVATIERDAFYGCEALTGVTIPESVTSLGTSAFAHCGLVTVSIHSSITKLEDELFSSCRQLTWVDIPTSVTEIGSAFYGCTALLRVEIPESVAVLGSNAFKGSGLLELTIPASVQCIGRDAFLDCASLKELTVLGRNTEFGSHAYGYRYNNNSHRYYAYSGNALYGYADSTAERYAAANSDITFVPLESDAVDIATCTITVRGYEFVSAGYRPTVTVKNGNGVTLEQDVDYTLTFTGCDTVGTGSVTVQGIGDYAGSVTKTFSITKASLKDAVIPKVANKTYTGSAIKPSAEVRVNDTKLTPTIDYAVTYKNNVNVGEATMTLTGKGNYTGTRTVKFKIVSKSISGVTVSSIAVQKWTGKQVKPKPTVKDGKKTLTLDVDYKLTYKNNVNPGTATVVITGKGNYKSSKSVSFTIGAKRGTWRQSGGKWWYEYLDGGFPKAEFANIDGARYYFDASGWMATGWKQVSGKWYYFGTNGKMQKSSWVKSGSDWCYVGSDGVMVTTWLTLSGNTFWFDSSGRMATGWKQIKGKYYYFMSSGVMARNKWVGDYWLKDDGTMAVNEWVDGDKYYVGFNGAWVKGRTR